MRSLAAILQVHAAERDRDDLGARRLEGAAGLVDVLVLARAHEEARLERVAADRQRCVRHAPRASRPGRAGPARPAPEGPCAPAAACYAAQDESPRAPRRMRARAPADPRPFARGAGGGPARRPRRSRSSSRSTSWWRRPPYVVVATAGERHSVWEDLPGGRRIVTYTRVTVERDPRSARRGPEILGPHARGRRGQDRAERRGRGAARRRDRGRCSSSPRPNGVVVVTAMAQGHYPIVADDRGRPPARGEPGRGDARPEARARRSRREERLVGAALDDAAAAVQQLGKARDATK